MVLGEDDRLAQPVPSATFRPWVIRCSSTLSTVSVLNSHLFIAGGFDGAGQRRLVPFERVPVLLFFLGRSSYLMPSRWKFQRHRNRLGRDQKPSSPPRRAHRRRSERRAPGRTGGKCRGRPRPSAWQSARRAANRNTRRSRHISDRPSDAPHRSRPDRNGPARSAACRRCVSSIRPIMVG